MNNKTALSEFDYTRLSSLAQALSRGSKAGGALALRERLRDSLVFNEDMLAASYVRMNSVATLREVGTGATFVYRLVFPALADIASGRLSVLSPLGAALLGRREGESFLYTSPGGTMSMRVESVRHEG